MSLRNLQSEFALAIVIILLLPACTSRGTYEVGAAAGDRCRCEASCLPRPEASAD